MAVRAAAMLWAAIACGVMVSARAEEFDSYMPPFLEKKDAAAGDMEAPVVKPVDPKAPFPQLPPVMAMLNGSDHTVDAIVTEVSKIQARVHSLEQKDQATLAQKKAEFEADLKEKEQKTRMVISESAEIAKRIKDLQRGNEALRQSARDLGNQNKQMREELKAAEEKIAAAGNFVEVSLKATDDRKAKDLAVLSPAHKAERRVAPAPTAPVAVADDAADDSTSEDEQTDGPAPGDAAPQAEVAPARHMKLFGKAGLGSHITKSRSSAATGASSGDDEDDNGKDDADDAGAESFMQRRMRRSEEEFEERESDLPWRHAGHHHKHAHGAKAAPKEEGAPVDNESKDLLQMVQQELANLARQDQQGMEQQARLFEEDLAGEQRAHKAALKQQRSLNTTEASLRELQGSLKVAVSHLDATRTHLEQRMRGVGQYFQHLAHLLLAPPKEVSGLIEAMPQEVPVPAPLLANATTTSTASALPTQQR